MKSENFLMPASLFVGSYRECERELQKIRNLPHIFANVYGIRAVDAICKYRDRGFRCDSNHDLKYFF
jgi:hypothetical protein